MLGNPGNLFTISINSFSWSPIAPQSKHANEDGEVLFDYYIWLGKKQSQISPSLRYNELGNQCLW
jgi:hypothetical protein